MSESAVNLIMDAAPSLENREVLRELLAAYNWSFIGPVLWTPLDIYIRDEHGKIVAGVSGATAWNWLHVDMLVVSEAIRGLGHGSRLLLAAEDEAARRGCTDVYLDTFSFQAQPFYEKLGYTIVGVLNDFPSGHTRYFMTKRLFTQDAEIKEG